MGRRLRWTVGTLAVLVIAASAGIATFAVTRAVRPPAAAPAPGYAVTCAACPAGARITSVEVQPRSGSTLFVLRGTWPATADGLKSDIRLDANDVQLVLHPHGSLNAFEVVSATRAGSPLDPAAVGATITRGALVVNLAPALPAPVAFDVGLWNGSAFTARVPGSGQLRWTDSAYSTA